MSDDLRDRVRQVMEEAEERSASLDSDDDEGAAEAFGDVPERANELVEDADPGELLNAVSSDDLSVEESPETMADAMERADTETLLELRKLLTLSRMAREEGEEARAEHVETFRELSREGDAAEAEEPEGPGEGDGTDDAAPDDAGDEQSAPDEEEEESDGDDRLREALLGEVDGFRERIQTARSELGDEAEDESEGEAEASEDSQADEEESEVDTSGGGGGSSRKGGTMFSTIPSRDRSDMRGPDRFSTVRKR